MSRLMTSTALAFAGVLLLAGCTAGGSGGATTAAAESCETLRSDVRDISNGAQNTLAAGGDPAEMQTQLEGYSERVTELNESVGEEFGVTDQLTAFGEEIDAAAEFAATLPSDPEAEVDSDAVAEHQTAIEEAADNVNDACTED